MKKNQKIFLVFLIVFSLLFFPRKDSEALAPILISFQAAIFLQLSFIFIYDWFNPDLDNPVFFTIELQNPSDDKNRSSIQSSGASPAPVGEQIVEMTVRKVESEKISSVGSSPVAEGRVYVGPYTRQSFSACPWGGCILNIDQRYEFNNFDEAVDFVKSTILPIHRQDYPLYNFTLGKEYYIGSPRWSDRGGPAYLDKIVKRQNSTTVSFAWSGLYGYEGSNGCCITGLSSANEADGAFSRAYFTVYPVLDSPQVERCKSNMHLNDSGVCVLDEFNGGDRKLDFVYDYSGGFKSMNDPDQTSDSVVSSTQVSVPIVDKRFGSGTITVKKSSVSSNLIVTQKFSSVPTQVLYGTAVTSTMELSTTYNVVGDVVSQVATGEINANGPGSGGGGNLGEGINVGGVWLTGDGLSPVTDEDVCQPGERVNADGTCGGDCGPGHVPGADGQCVCPNTTAYCECPAGSPGRWDSGECKAVCPSDSIVESGTCRCEQVALIFDESQNVCRCEQDGFVFDADPDVNQCLGPAPSSFFYQTGFNGSFPDLSGRISQARGEYLTALQKFHGISLFEFSDPGVDGILPCFGPWDILGNSISVCLDSLSGQLSILRYLFPFVFGLFSIGIVFGAYRTRRKKRV
ncbi:MAG: hypothetical protein HQL75_07245 [Magnetococcales bacterium]|nr:hypothetical protein [Magnetococcales bacterium]